MITVTDLKLKPVKIKKDFTFEVLVLSVKPCKNSFDGKILGKQLFEWVCFASRNIPTRVIEYDEKTSILDFVKDKLNKRFDYTIVLLSRTPLLQNADILSIMEYTSFKEVKVCKLPCGYVIDNRIQLGENDIMIDSVYSMGEENFYVVDTKKQFSYALGVLQSRINNFHIDNGVEIVDRTKVYIETDVDIGRGTIIYPGNNLKGQTYIGEEVILKENNVICGSRIGSHSYIGGSTITDCELSDSVMIGGYSTITNTSIGSSAVVEGHCEINNYKIKSKEKVSSFSCLGDRNDSCSGIR